MTTSNTSIVSLIDSQLPDFIREDNPKFGAFLKAYYAWMEDSLEGAQLYHMSNLLDYRDIDRTLDQFIDYYKRDFLPNFPKETALSEAKLLKTAREFYSKKGSKESIEYLFRVIYNKEVNIFYPKEQVIRSSAGRWNIPISIKVSAQNITFDPTLLVKRKITGLTSHTTCVVESVDVYVDIDLGSEIAELFISNIVGTFSAAETIHIEYGDNLVFQDTIFGFIYNISIDANNAGLGYKSGDPVSIVGGTTANSLTATAVVGNVSSGSIKSATVTKGGYGFSVHPNTTVIITPSATISNASIIVESIDTANAIYLLLNTDTIQSKSNIAVNAANLTFANIATSNQNTALSNAFSFSNISFSPLESLLVVDAGAGYGSVPTLDYNVIYTTDYSPYPQLVNDLGKIAGIAVLNPGGGYSNVTDKIVFSTETGYSAAATFSTDANGSITSVTLTNRGEGYFSLPGVALANTANTLAPASGSGAVIQAYGFGEGSATSLSVDEIGRVSDIVLTSKGYGYESSPILSMKNMDIKLNPVPPENMFTESNVVYQGTDVGNTTFISYVDKFDTGNSVLRLYNFIGNLNVYANLVFSGNTTFNCSINTSATNSVTKFGNGKAVARLSSADGSLGGEVSGTIKHDGFWSGTDGFLSWDQFLQDDKKYHNFSYELYVEQSLLEYKDALMNLVHPSGMSMLGVNVLPDNKTYSQTDILGAEIALRATTSNGTASVAIGSTAVTGIGTTFLEYGTSHADYIVFSPGTDREMTCIINLATSNTSIDLIANTDYFPDTRLTLVSNSNVVYLSANTVSIAANDILHYVDGSNTSTSKVISISGMNVTTNVVSTTNANNVLYSVSPVINNVSYKIIRIV